MAVVGDEEVGAHFGHVDLHADQAVGVAGQVVQGDALAEVECSFVEGLPVPAGGKVVVVSPGDLFV